MAVVQINTNPSVRQLRQFGILFIIAFGILGGILLRRTGSLELAVAVWGGALAVALVGFALPRFMRWVYVGMVYAAFPIGWVVSHVVLAIVLYAIMTPIGLVMRLAGRDPMTRPFDGAAPSYWTSHDPAGNIDRYFRQF